jgi:hypothetical protein
MLTDTRRSAAPPEVAREVDRLLRQSPSFGLLDRKTQRAMADALGQITAYLSGPPGAPARTSAVARQLAPLDLQRRLAPQGDGASGGAAPAPAPASAPAPAPGGSGSSSATARVGDVARATLNAIDFPHFVASLIQGTFQAIVDASIQQMEAYATLLKNVAATVDQFMTDNISEGTAKDYLADRYDGFLSRDPSAQGGAGLKVNPDAPTDGELPSFFKDLGFQAAGEIDDNAMQQTVVPAARRSLAEQRQQVLATMVLMGINRIVVDDGEITAKLQFHIDASETTNLRFDQTKTTAGNLSGRAGSSPFTANAIMVNTTSLNAQSDINIRTDLTGQVRVHFRSETFPLERFADSAAIQLINQNAKVPQPLPASQPPPAGGAAAPPAGAEAAAPALPTPGPSPQAPAPATAPPRAPASQGFNGGDPWAPGGGR